MLLQFIIALAILYHGIALLAYICLGKFMLTNKIMLMRIVMSPAKSVKGAGKGIAKAVRHAAWCIGLGILLSMMC